MYRYKIIILTFLLFLPGCSSSFSLIGGGRLPEWVESPPADSSKELIGVGEGSSLERAKEAALNDIAGKLGTHVTRTVDRVVSVDGDRIKDVARIANTTQIKLIKLIQPRVINSAKYEGSYYVLLAVSRVAMVRDMRSRLRELDQRLKQQWKVLPALSDLQQFVRVKKLSSQVDKASSLAITLQTLDRNFASRPYLERYNGYRKKSDELLRNTRFRIRSTKAMRPVGQLLVQLLSRDEIQSIVVEDVGTRSLDPYIEVKSEVKQKTIFATEFSDLSVFLVVKDKRGNVIASRKHEASGKSLEGFSAATRIAMEKLINHLKGQAVLSVIGLNVQKPE